MTRQSPWEKSPDEIETDTAILPPSLAEEQEEPPGGHEKKVHKKVEIELPAKQVVPVGRPHARPSRAARVAAVAALVALTLVFLGAAGAHYRLLAPFLGFRLFAAGLVLGGFVAFVAGFLGMLRTAKRAYAGRGEARFGLLVGAALLAAAVSLLLGRESRAPIHDITTDPANPPGFLELAVRPQNQGRDLTYPHGPADTPELQRLHYGELEPIEVLLPVGEALEAAQQSAFDCGWKVVRVHPELGLIEAEDESDLFRFVDDVAVRVEALPGGERSRIDLRSTSRVGVSDLGANAARIRAFEACLRAGLRE